MKQVKSMSQAELAAHIQDSLQEEGIRVVLSGGSAVAFYTSNKYVSKDLDLINTNFVRRREIRSVMEKLGFREQGRYLSIQIQNIMWNFPTVLSPSVKNLSKKSMNLNYQPELCA